MAEPRNSSAKTASREEVAKRCLQLRADGARVCLTTGVFDLLHSGHIDYLEAAKSRADVLVVGINSDTSVTALKGPGRPIMPFHERARMIAGLECVDFVFAFEELNSRKSIEALRPDIYVKGGDYSHQHLSSGDLLRSYGAEIFIAGFRSGCSSTAIIERILAKHPLEAAPSLRPYPRGPAVFFDRDGTINLHIDDLHQPERVRVIDGAGAAICGLRESGYRIVIVTNQPGIGIGYFSKDDFFQVNKQILRVLAQEQGYIDKIYFCPHSMADKCGCRKPNTGLIEKAAEEMNLDLKRSFMVGDMTSDVRAGKDSGCRTILVKTGRGGNDGLCDIQADFVAADIKEAADLVRMHGGVSLRVEKQNVLF